MRRACRSDILYHDGLTRYMGPPPFDDVGLNTQNCLTSGGLGLPLGKDKSTREPRDKDREAIALINAMLKSGIAVTITTIESYKGTIAYKLHLPAALYRAALPIHAAARKELRLDMPLKTRAVGILRLFEHQLPRPTAVRGSIQDMLVLARYDLRLELNGFSSPLVGKDDNDDHVSFMSEAGSDLLAIIDKPKGKAPFEVLLSTRHFVRLPRSTIRKIRRPAPFLPAHPLSRRGAHRPREARTTLIAPVLPDVARRAVRERICFADGQGFSLKVVDGRIELQTTFVKVAAGAQGRWQQRRASRRWQWRLCSAIGGTIRGVLDGGEPGVGFKWCKRQRRVWRPFALRENGSRRLLSRRSPPTGLDKTTLPPDQDCLDRS